MVISFITDINISSAIIINRKALPIFSFNNEQGHISNDNLKLCILIYTYDKSYHKALCTKYYLYIYELYETTYKYITMVFLFPSLC